MSIKVALLAGVSLFTICAGAAFAKSTPNLVVTALHPGTALVKTAVHAKSPTNLTTTIGVSTGVTDADYKKKTPLAAPYYTFNHSGTTCDEPKEKIKLSTTKTKYAMLSTGTETETISACSTGPTKFYGDVYELTTKKAVKKPDTFVSMLIAKDLHNGGNTYKKATLNLDVAVTISK
jgi:hypothetical protein